MLQEDLHKIGDEGKLPKRMVFLAKSKEQLGKRWLGEYLYALEERKLRQNGSHVEILYNSKVVLLKEDTKNRAQWRIGRVVGEVISRDGVVHGLKIKLGNGYIVEQLLQLIYYIDQIDDDTSDDEDDDMMNELERQIIRCLTIQQLDVDDHIFVMFPAKKTACHYV